MKANELRIGNLLQLTGEQCEVISVTNDQIGVVLGSKAVVHISHLQGIPLTPEILERCGLHRDSPSVNVWSNYHMIIFYKEDELIKGFYTTYWKGAVVIQYLHQLQNLYYALTGTDLTISHNNK